MIGSFNLQNICSLTKSKTMLQKQLKVYLNTTNTIINTLKDWTFAIILTCQDDNEVERETRHLGCWWLRAEAGVGGLGWEGPEFLTVLCTGAKWRNLFINYSWFVVEKNAD